LQLVEDRDLEVGEACRLVKGKKRAAISERNHGNASQAPEGVWLNDDQPSFAW